MRPKDKVPKSLRHKLYEQGREAFNPDRRGRDVCPDDIKRDEARLYYWKCGWQKGKDEWEKEEEYRNRPICPICAQKCIEKISGLFCENEEECGYHTHEGLTEDITKIEEDIRELLLRENEKEI